MTNISLLSTVFPYGNKGDEAIYETSIGLIRKYCPDSEISLVSFSTPGFEPDHQLIQSLYKLDKTISYPAGIVNSIVKRSFSKRGQGPNKFASWVNRFWYWDLSPFLSPLTLPARLRPVDKLNNSDVFVIVGHPLVKGLLSICLRAYSIKMIETKPALVFPSSVSLHPFSKPKILDSILRLYVSAFLNKMDVVLVREKYSMQYLRENMGVKSNVVLSADTSFLLPPADENSTLGKLQKTGISFEKPAIAVCPRGDYFENALVPKNYEDFIQNMTILADELIEILDANVYFVPMTPKEDSCVINDIYKLMKHKKNVQIIDTESMNAKEVKTLFSHMDFLITMRLHAAILAASSYVPSVVIMTSQDLKSVGVVEDLGLSEYFIYLENPKLTTQEMVNNAVNLYDNLKELKRLLKERIPKIQKRSELAGQTLKYFV